MKREGEFQKDSFLCTCGPCRRFWQESFKGVSSSLYHSPLHRAEGTSSLGGGRYNILHYGDRVLMNKQYPGVVRYVGFLDDQTIAPRLHVGIKLDDNVKSLHNGIYKGKRYFECPLGHGAMACIPDVHPVSGMAAKPPTTGNSMFPSYKQVCKRRKERDEQLKIMYEQSQKTRTFQPPLKMPLISPKPNKTTNLRMSSTTATYSTRDPDDIALKDELRKEHKKQKLEEANQVSPKEQQLRKWRKAFGGDEQGFRMAATLQKLQTAYNEGLILTHRRHSVDI